MLITVCSSELEWARARRLRFSFGTAKRGFWCPVLDHAGHQYYPFRVSSLGKVEILFLWLTAPPFDGVEMRRELRRRLNEIPGVSIPEDAITRRPSIPLALLAADPEALESLKAALDWCFEAARSGAEDLAEG